MGFHIWIYPCTVDSVVNGINTILSKIALSVNPAVTQESLNMWIGKKINTNYVCISALVTQNIIGCIYEWSVDGNIMIIITDREKMNGKGRTVLNAINIKYTVL